MVTPALPTLANAEGRRAWAFVAIWLGCVAFTAMAAWAMYLVSGQPRYVLWLGLAAHLQLLIGMGAFGFVLGRRMQFTASRSGVEMTDREQAAAQAGAELAANAAVATAEELKQ